MKLRSNSAPHTMRIAAVVASLVAGASLVEARMGAPKMKVRHAGGAIDGIGTPRALSLPALPTPALARLSRTHAHAHALSRSHPRQAEFAVTPARRLAGCRCHGGTGAATTAPCAMRARGGRLKELAAPPPRTPPRCRSVRESGLLPFTRATSQVMPFKQKPLTLNGVHGGVLHSRGMLGQLHSQATGKVQIQEYEDAQFYGPITVGCVPAGRSIRRLGQDDTHAAPPATLAARRARRSRSSSTRAPLTCGSRPRTAPTAASIPHSMRAPHRPTSWTAAPSTSSTAPAP